MIVPHFFQSSQVTCGAACLPMLFDALGRPEDEATIAGRGRMTPVGCTVQDLVEGAQASGLEAELLPVRDEPAAIAALSQLAPFVAMIDLGNLYVTASLFQWHFVV